MIRSSEQGWWLMELLLAITLVGALTAVGVMTFAQALFWSDGLSSQSISWQADMVRLALGMQRDARHCSRIIATDDDYLLYDGAPLSNITHGKSDLIDDIEAWDLNYPVNLSSSQTRSIIESDEGASVSLPANSSDFLGGWANADSSLTRPTIDGGYSSTILFLEGLDEIYSVVYIKATPSTDDDTITYNISHYYNNGNRLVLSEQFEYVADGYTSTQDQINDSSDADEHGIYVKNDYFEKENGFLSSAPGCAYGLRLPSALSKGNFELREGTQLRRIKTVPEFVMFLMPRRGEARLFDAADWISYWKEENGY